jgi:hypothetical protein
MDLVPPVVPKRLRTEQRKNMTNQRKRTVARPRMLFIALALAAAGCATSGRPVADEGGVTQDVEVTVENQNFQDAVVYAIWGAGPRDRLGMVTGNTTETFTAEVQAGGDMRIEVDLIAGNNVVTESRGVFRGDDIRVVIPPRI